MSEGAIMDNDMDINETPLFESPKSADAAFAEAILESDNVLEEKVRNPANDAWIRGEVAEVSSILAQRNLAHANAVAKPVTPRKTLYLKFGKRIFDIILSGIALLITLPINIVLGILTFRDVGSPIFYVQERTGKDLKSFKMVKFRNMTNDCDETGQLLPPEERITKLGLFVRSHSLDELLNFWSVFKGDIPLRIIKTGQGEPCEISGLFALPAKEMRTQKVLFPQVKVASGTCLRTVQNFFSNHTAQRAQTQRILAKRKFTPISWGGGFGGLTLCELWLLSHGTTSGLVS